MEGRDATNERVSTCALSMLSAVLGNSALSRTHCMETETADVVAVCIAYHLERSIENVQSSVPFTLQEAILPKICMCRHSRQAHDLANESVPALNAWA